MAHRIPYKKLLVWKKGMDLATYIYKITNNFPSKELYGITNQLRRACISIPSNIAEGSSRSSDKHFIIFLENAQGSLFEIETQCILSKDFGYIDTITLDILLEKTNEIGKMSTGLIKSIRKQI